MISWGRIIWTPAKRVLVAPGFSIPGLRSMRTRRSASSALTSSAALYMRGRTSFHFQRYGTACVVGSGVIASFKMAQSGLMLNSGSSA